MKAVSEKHENGPVFLIVLSRHCHLAHMLGCFDSI
jgi:hypothetical protein